MVEMEAGKEGVKDRFETKKAFGWDSIHGEKKKKALKCHGEKCG